jgi:hypothetical protein
MSDHFQMLVDPVVDEDQAGDLCGAVVDRFRGLGLIVGELGPEGYKPGPALTHLYRPREGERGFPYELVSNGVEPHIGRDLNAWAFGPVCQGFDCRYCHHHFPETDKAFFRAASDAIGQWFDRSDSFDLTCPRCSKQTPITEWRCIPPLGFGNLSFQFWNWPQLDAPEWKIDLRTLVADITGHPVVATYGRI